MYNILDYNGLYQHILYESEVDWNDNKENVVYKMSIFHVLDNAQTTIHRLSWNQYKWSLNSLETAFVDFYNLYSFNLMANLVTKHLEAERIWRQGSQCTKFKMIFFVQDTTYLKLNGKNISKKKS